MFERHSTTHQVIHIQPQAASKPPMGAPCNGCGVCCLAEPCPLGVLLSCSRTGPCKALQWVPDQHQYRCGALTSTVANQAISRSIVMRRVLAAMEHMRVRVLRRWIAAGVGCDCDLEPAPSSTIKALNPHSGDLPHD
jgi:hypothetical protein